MRRRLSPGRGVGRSGHAPSVLAAERSGAVSVISAYRESASDRRFVGGVDSQNPTILRLAVNCEDHRGDPTPKLHTQQ